MKTMEDIILTFPTIDLREKALDYRQEHFDNGEPLLHGGALLDQTESYENWLNQITRNANPYTVDPNWVVSSTFFAVRKKDERIIGTIDIRHYLNDFLAAYGGHIGYGIRPSERNKGYATQLLKHGLEYSKDLGLKRVMLACYKENIASRKTIINNGGKLEKEFIHTDGKEVQIFWINLE